jgi:hypothetical protein
MFEVLVPRIPFSIFFFKNFQISHLKKKTKKSLKQLKANYTIFHLPFEDFPAETG